MSAPAAGRPSKTVNSPRHRAREFILQALYQWRLGCGDEAAIEAQMYDSQDFDKADRAFFTDLLRGIFVQHVALEALLDEHLDRPHAELSPVEASALLIGAYELANCLETPYRVIINEAIELAKDFGGTDGHKYVNGVLDKLAARLRADEVKARRANRSQSAAPAK